MLFGNRNGMCAGFLLKHCDLAVAINEMRGDVQVHQNPQSFGRHWARQYVPADQDLVYVQLPDLRQYRFEGRQVSVDVVQGCNRHGDLRRFRSFVTQGDQRIDRRGAAGGHETGGETDRRNTQSRQSHRQRIIGRDSVE